MKARPYTTKMLQNNAMNDQLFDDPFARLNLRLRVGEHIIDRGSLRVVTHPARVRLTGKAMAVLIELAKHAGDTVTREELMNRVWQDRKTTGNVLAQAVRRLRYQHSPTIVKGRITSKQYPVLDTGL